jgi:hypothetical protein
MEVDMRLRCTALFACSMLLPCPSPADDHLVSPQQIQSLLTGAAAERRQNIATLERTLSTPAAEQAAGRVGADLGRVRQALPALTDAEARDLGCRPPGNGDGPAGPRAVGRPDLAGRAEAQVTAFKSAGRYSFSSTT